MQVMADVSAGDVAVCVFVGLFTWLALVAYRRLWAEPRLILSDLQRQGVRGPPFRFIFGQLPEMRKLLERRLADPVFAASASPTPFLAELHSLYGTTFHLQVGSQVSCVLVHPSLVRSLLVAGSAAIAKPDFGAGRLLGQGLVTSNGHLWAKQRRLINPAFKPERVQGMFETMVACAVQATARLHSQLSSSLPSPSSSSSPSPSEIRMDRELSRLTLEVVGRTVFGTAMGGDLSSEPTEEANELLTALAGVTVAATPDFSLLMLLPFSRMIPTAKNRQARRNIDVVRKLIQAIIAKRRGERGQQAGGGKSSGEGGEGGKEESGSSSSGGSGKFVDLLDLMMEATEGEEEGSSVKGATTVRRDNPAASASASSAARTSNTAANAGTDSGASTGGVSSQSALQGGGSSSSSKMSDQQLQDECVTFFLAGHDTTSTLLSWTLMLLAQHQHWQRAVREEVRGVLGRDAGNGIEGNASATNLTLEKLAEMKMVGWVLNEALRLYPPVAFMSYQCQRPVRLSESLTLPAGCNANIAVSLIHRSKEVWGEDAEEFKPDRFSVGSSGGGKPGAFMPFSLGPRFCIGQNFALQEAKVILALLVMNFSWELGPSFKLFPQLAIIMKNKYGLPLVVKAL